MNVEMCKSLELFLYIWSGKWEMGAATHANMKGKSPLIFQHRLNSQASFK